MSKYRTLHFDNWTEEVYVTITVENTVPWKYVIEYLNGEEMFGTYCEKELKKINQTEFIVEKAI